MGVEVSQTITGGLRDGAMPRLPEPHLIALQEATVTLCRGFEQLYGITITPPTVRLLTESELDTYIRDGGPPWKRNLVNLCAGQDIGLNPYISQRERLEILPHEIGHVVLDAAGFDVEPYLPGGLMGPKRVLHEMVAEAFQADGAVILREHKLVGNIISRWLEGFISPWSPLMSFMQTKSLIMKDLLADPDVVLVKYTEFFAPRAYGVGLW